jgi:beta-lactamase superfamily II metal-dependent hydrolase
MKRIVTSASLLLLAGLALALLRVRPSGSLGPSAQFRWIMLDVTPGELQADAHLLGAPDGRQWLLDAGEGTEGALLDELRSLGVRRLESVIISHAHKDHYGALPSILAAGITIGSVVFAEPIREVCDKERPWGCDWGHVRDVRALVENKGVALRAAGPGEVLAEGPDFRLEVLWAYDGLHTPVGKTDINDTSLMLRLTASRKRALFTGDLNAQIGNHLAVTGADLRADVLKVPHHGAESTAGNAFFEAVGAAAALVPAPAALWASERCSRLRDFFGQRRTPVWVSGVAGRVTVTFPAGAGEVRIEAEPGRGKGARWFRRLSSLWPGLR